MRALISLLSAAALASCVSPAADAPGATPTAAYNRQCFWTSAVNSFEPISDQLINVRVGASQIYQLELVGPCPDVTWNNTIGIESRGSQRICSGLDAVVISPTSIGPLRCAVRNVRRLTPEEAGAGR